MTNDQGGGELVTVRLQRIPLGVNARSTQHFEELMREFALISLDADRERPSGETARPVPERLLALVDDLTVTFSAFTTTQQAERDEALARGDAEIDLTYRLPASAVDATRQLATILDEVDDYCRAGQHLITLATPPESQAFRRWYLGEFIRQIEQGEPPSPWPDYVAENHPSDAWATN